MSDLNKCLFTGRLSRDPIIRYTGEGKIIAAFSIACNWKYKTSEGVEWVNCTVFNDLANIAQTYLHKGSKVLVVCKKRTDKPYVNKDGVETTPPVGFIVEYLQMLDPKPSYTPGEDEKLPPEPRTKDVFEDEEIPF